MNDRLLHNTTHTALTERMKPKICSINDAVGNILRYRQKLYIVTCKHVADDFFSQNHQYIILRGNSRIYTDNLKYIASTNSEIDIALIEILHSSQVSEYFEEDDFEIIDDYNNKEIENTVFFIFGFPEQLYFNKDGKQYIPWMSYMTIKSKDKKSDEIIIAAHGNSLRALVKYLDNISEDEIVGLNIPTGIPLVFELDENLNSVKSYYLGDQEEIAKATAAVANQGKAK